MKTISLAGGAVAIVDDADYERLAQYRWREHRQGYAMRSGRRPGPRAVFMHREVLRAPKGREVDHINRDKLDNRRANLRLCTRAQNAANIVSVRRSQAGFRGVVFYPQRRKWRAYIQVQGRSINLGSFASPIAAARAYDDAARAIQGEFAVLNFPNGGVL